MNNTDKYTSLELSKLLQEAGCEIESEWCFVESSISYPEILNIRTIDLSIYTVLYPAYDILWDICCVHPKEFFGEEEVKITIKQNGNIVQLNEPAYMHNAKEVLNFMQQGKKEQAEKYIWENTIFNKENKGK